jgi:hypothetical protein
MGYLRFRKRVKLLPGVYINLSKTGVGLGAGVPGARVSIGADGKVRRSLGIPGSGFSHIDVLNSPSRQKKSRRGADPESPIGQPSSIEPTPVFVQHRGSFNRQVVSEHLHQAELRAVVARRGSNAGPVRLVAELHRELANGEDPNAIAVHLDGVRVGYLSKGFAPRFVPQMNALAAQGVFPATIARVYIGNDGAFAVELDLPGEYSDS